MIQQANNNNSNKVNLKKDPKQSHTLSGCPFYPKFLQLHMKDFDVFLQSSDQQIWYMDLDQFFLMANLYVILRLHLALFAEWLLLGSRGHSLVGEAA